MESPFHTVEFTHKGHAFIARHYTDDDMGAPWKEHDGHGPVSGFRPLETKRPGERPLGELHRDNTTRFYDWQAAIETAKRDSWGLGPDALAELTKRLGKAPTARQIRAEAVQRDFDRLDGWARDDWQWIGVSVSPMVPTRARLESALSDIAGCDDIAAAQDTARAALIADDEYADETYDNALWGIESDAGDYLMTVARDLADQIIATL